MHGTAECLASLRQMFGWAFSPDNVHQGYVKPAARVVDGAFSYGALRITPLPVEHAAMETIGYKFEMPGARSLAYLPDVKRIPSTTMDLLRAVDVLVLDALRPAPHPTRAPPRQPRATHPHRARRRRAYRRDASPRRP